MNEMKREKMKAKKYDKELRKLQVKLCKLQEWVKFAGLRVITMRDATGLEKGGTIRAITGAGVRPARLPHGRLVGRAIRSR